MNDAWANWMSQYWYVPVLIAAGIGVLAYQARHPQALQAKPKKAAHAGPESMGIYLIESVHAEKGAGFLAFCLVIYNVAMPIWMFTRSQAVDQIVLALMWIGGNQALGFMLTAGRKSSYEVFRRKSADPETS